MREIDWSQVWLQLGEPAVKLAAAYALALPIGWNRERARRNVGLRTFPLVSIASCSYIMLGLKAFGSDAEASARVLEGLITGMGFIGGGAILKNKRIVRGTSTAAALWSTGAIGATTAHGYYYMAVLISLVNLATFVLLTPVAHSLKNGDRPVTNKPSRSSDTGPGEV